MFDSIGCGLDGSGYRLDLRKGNGKRHRSEKSVGQGRESLSITKCQFNFVDFHRIEWLSSGYGLYSVKSNFFDLVSVSMWVNGGLDLVTLIIQIYTTEKVWMS